MLTTTVLFKKKKEGEETNKYDIFYIVPVEYIPQISIIP